MSQENVAAFRRAVDAGNRGDFSALLEELDPEVEWRPGMAAGLGGESAAVYRGREAAGQAIDELWSAFDGLHLEIAEIRERGDQIVAIGRMRGRTRAHGSGTGGVAVESPWAYLVRFRNGKAISVRSYTHPDEALEAAGLSE